jgi:hypothetical protein
VGGTRTAAGTALAAVGLTIGAVTSVNNAAVAGTVLSQSPVVGTSANPGTGIALTVSLGPPPVIVPNVVNQAQAAASSALSAVGLTVGTVTFQASTTVGAGNVISQSPVGGTSVPSASAVNLVVSQGTAPTIATVVTRNNASPNTTITSPAFPVAANTLLVAFISSDAPSTGTNVTVNSINNNASLPNLTWTRSVRANTQRGTGEVWWAFAPTARASMTVTSVLNFSEAASMTVVGFTGAANSLVGAASVIASGALNSNTFPSATLSTTKPNSWVFAVGVDWDSPRVMTAAGGQQIVSQFNPPVGDTYWVSRTTAAVPAAGTPTTMSLTYPGATHPDRWNLAVIEIRPR